MSTVLNKLPIEVSENDMLFPIFFVNDSHYAVYKLNTVSGDYISFGFFKTLKEAKLKREMLMDEVDVYTVINPKRQ